MNVRRILDASHARDPGWYALHRGIRAAVVVPAVFAFASQVIGDAQVATFAAFGCFALLMFVDFGGRPSSRLGAFVMLGVVGAVLITTGTLMSQPGWLAVLGMAVAGFAVLFAGILSSAAAGAARGALLTFILPATLPGTASDIAPRLAGWGLALITAVPAAMLVWPPRRDDELRRRTASTCGALAELLRLTGDTDSTPAARTDRLATVKDELGGLRATFRATASRPVGLSTGSRALVRMVDDLEWLTSIAAHTCSDGWPPVARQLTVQAAEVLDASAKTLASDGSSVTHRLAQLDAAQHRLAERRDELAQLTATALAPSDGRTASDPAPAIPPYRAHELAYAVTIAGQAAALAAAADARPIIDRLLGRRPVGATLGTLTAAERIAAGHVHRNSVWLHNSLRGAAGLAIAVLVAKLSGAQHEFWVVLGAMSVLRSNALSTGSTVVRAIAGTIIGFAIGGLLVALIGTSPSVLWPLLPFAVFVAALAPDVISFAAGQAAFTVVVIILFNIIAPEGWQIGLLRVEDVVFGCGASLAVGVLLWPRGAAGALGTALGDGYRRGVEYLTAAVQYAADGGSDPGPEHVRARAAAWRLDDAFRQYLAERGAKQVPLASLTFLANGATRLRLAGDAVVSLRSTDEGGSSAGQNGSARGLADARHVLSAQVDTVTAWYEQLADAVQRHDGGDGRFPAPARSESEQRILAALPRPAGADARVTAVRAQGLLWTGEYLDDLQDFQERLVEPLGQLLSEQDTPWWRQATAG